MFHVCGYVLSGVADSRLYVVCPQNSFAAQLSGCANDCTFKSICRGILSGEHSCSVNPNRFNL